MKTRLTLMIALGLLPCACPAWVAGQSAPQAEGPFPMAKGAVWIYQGTVKWAEAHSNQIREKTVTWKMEVTERLRRGGVVAAVLKGHPDDLIWYTEGKERGDFILVGVGGTRYYLLKGTEVEPALKKLRDPDGILQGLVGEGDLFLDLPLTPGKAYGETEMLTRVSDGLYRWWVEDAKEEDLSGVKGVQVPGRMTVYTVSYRALTDHTFIDFVPQVGITRYMAGHHGTVSEVDVKLVEYHAGIP